MKLWEKVVVVTGGGGGIGRAVVVRALARGARVAAVDVRADLLEETAAEAEAGQRLSLHVCDISDREAVAKLPQEIVDTHGVVDVLINNAGTLHAFEHLWDLDDAEIDRVLQVNIGSALWPTRAFLPHLMKRPQAWIASMSSLAGFVPFPRQSIYGASKAAVHLLTESLYEELHDTNIGVSVIVPGAVDTELMAHSGVPPTPGALGPRPLPVDEASRQILDGIEGGKRHVLVGGDAKMLWVADRLAPNRTADLLRSAAEKLFGEKSPPRE